MPEITPDQLPKSTMPPLAQALAVKVEREKAAAETGRKVSGAELAVIRRAVMAGSHDSPELVAQARALRRGLRKITVEHMPPSSDLVWLLVETISQRHGAVGHGKAWESIGINRGRGRDLLARSASAVHWPIWSTLLRAALD